MKMKIMLYYNGFFTKVSFSKTHSSKIPPATFFQETVLQMSHIF